MPKENNSSSLKTLVVSISRNNHSIAVHKSSSNQLPNMNQVLISVPNHKQTLQKTGASIGVKDAHLNKRYDIKDGICFLCLYAYKFTHDQCVFCKKWSCEKWCIYLSDQGSHASLESMEEKIFWHVGMENEYIFHDLISHWYY